MPHVDTQSAAPPHWLLLNPQAGLQGHSMSCALVLKSVAGVLALIVTGGCCAGLWAKANPASLTAATLIADSALLLTAATME